MPDQRPNQHIVANISGSVGGQVGIGDNISQSLNAGGNIVAVTEAERQELRDVLAGVRATVAAEAPDDQRDAATERIDELQEAVFADKPNVTTIRYIAQWFGSKLPQLAGIVTGVFVNPIVGKLVEAGGVMAADEFRKLMGADAPGD